MQKEQVEDKELKEQEKTSQKEANEAKEQESADQQEEQEQSEEKDPVEELKIEVAEAKDKYLRLYSEFENFRRRTAKERLDLISTANKDLMEDLVPVLDDFERAIKSLEDDFGQGRYGIDLQ